MKERDELYWIELAKNGDKSALEFLYRSNFSVLFKYVYYHVEHKEICEDIVAEAFVKGFSALGKFKAKSTFKTWIYSIARNLIFDFYRTKYKYTGISDNLTVLSEERKIPVEKIKEVKEMLKYLNPKYREVIELRFFSHLSVKETANILKTSENNVKVMQNRAIKEIKLRIKN
jgi:RNA polymerase sigma-70 factor, ECF subfamily